MRNIGVKNQNMYLILPCGDCFDFRKERISLVIALNLFKY